MEDEEIEDMEAVFGVDAEQDHLDPVLLEDIELDDPNNQPEQNRIDPFHDIYWIETPVERVVVHHLRDGTVSQETLGPQTNRIYRGAINIPLSTKTPAQYLDLLFSPELLGRFVLETNQYVARQANPPWSMDNQLTTPELKKYFAILLYQGLVKRPNDRYYWTSKSILQDNFVKTIGMSRTRFWKIAFNLHYLDTSVFTERQKNARKQQDGFWSIADFLTLLSSNFQYYFECGQYISIDEMCIFAKVRHKCLCYNPSKPNKWHFKVYALCDAITGYLSKFTMYRGRDILMKLHIIIRDGILRIQGKEC